ncbi:hypothetical protein [Streptomyces sp. NPDC058371]|uniref:hypothetical protein n=1 Tax=Streptomyces sp. NPDC058371 TaxID=3346463 RepID=UPI00365E9D46
MISRCAEAANVDVFELMAAVAEIDRGHPGEDMVWEAANAMAARQPPPGPSDPDGVALRHRRPQRS